MTKEELDKAAYKISGQNVKARLEVSPQRRPLAKAQATFFKGFKEVAFVENIRYPALCEEILLPNIHARTNVMRMKVGLWTCMQCQKMYNF